jgi:hypothetical protein
MHCSNEAVSRESAGVGVEWLGVGVGGGNFMIGEMAL